MKSAREFVDEIFEATGDEMETAIEARDAEVRAEEHEARTALFALERAAHKKQLRDVRAATWRHWSRQAKLALAAADAIPDASIVTTVKGDCGHCGGSWPTTQDVLKHFRETNCGAAAPKPSPSRAELIELIRHAACAATIADIEAGANWAAMALDALIKAGAVRT